MGARQKRFVHWVLLDREVEQFKRTRANIAFNPIMFWVSELSQILARRIYSPEVITPTGHNKYHGHIHEDANHEIATGENAPDENSTCENTACKNATHDYTQATFKKRKRRSDEAAQRDERSLGADPLDTVYSSDNTGEKEPVGAEKNQQRKVKGEEDHST